MLARFLAGLLIVTTAFVLVSPASKLLCGRSSHRAWQRRATAPASVSPARHATEEHSDAAQLLDLARPVLLPAAKCTTAGALMRPVGGVFHPRRLSLQRYGTVFVESSRQPLVLRT